MKRKKKEKPANHNSFNYIKKYIWFRGEKYTNISDIENKTLSLKNNSKEYLNFELSELEEKKNSKENILLEPKYEEK